MRKYCKKTIYFFVILASFFMFQINAMATGNNYYAVDSSCIDKGECLLLCNYVTKYKSGGSYATGYQSQTRSRSISIYLYYNDTMAINFSNTNTNAATLRTGTKSFAKLTGMGAIHWHSSSSASNFYCPKYGYLDLDGFNGGNEVCFDDDGSSCASKGSGFATTFGTKSTTFISSEKDYDVFEHIDTYFREWVYGDVECSDLVNKNFDANTDVDAKFSKDFKTNFLKGHNMPTFIADYVDNYNSTNLTRIKNNLNAKITACRNEVNSNLQAGNIDEATAQEQLEVLDNIDVDAAVDTVGTSIKREVNASRGDNTIIAENQTCKTLFGNPNDATHSSPAYWFQYILDIMKYIAIAALIVLSTLDFFKAIVQDDKDAIKKAGTTTLKRLIYCVLIFFVPTLVNFLMHLVGAYGTCGLR